jgi:hypothetical protein
MSGTLANHLSSGAATVVVPGAIVVAALGAWAVRTYLNNRPTPAQLERRRRNTLHSRGKMGDATLLEYREHFVFYSYAVRGVEYTASQDLSDLKPLLPGCVEHHRSGGHQIRPAQSGQLHRAVRAVERIAHGTAAELGVEWHFCLRRSDKSLIL